MFFFNFDFLAYGWCQNINYEIILIHDVGLLEVTGNTLYDKCDDIILFYDVMK